MSKSFFILFCVMSSLTGCNPFMVMRPDSEQLVKRGWAKYPKEQRIPDPLYCYSTLADKVCHSYPRDTETNRLSGYYGPEP